MSKAVNQGTAKAANGLTQDAKMRTWRERRSSDVPSNEHMKEILQKHGLSCPIDLTATALRKRFKRHFASPQVTFEGDGDAGRWVVRQDTTVQIPHTDSVSDANSRTWSRYPREQSRVPHILCMRELLRKHRGEAFAEGTTDAVRKRFKKTWSINDVHQIDDQWVVDTNLRAFPSVHQFQLFFREKTDLMRSLLNRYTGKAASLVELPLLPKQACHDAIASEFFRRFNERSFLVKDINVKEVDHSEVSLFDHGVVPSEGTIHISEAASGHDPAYVHKLLAAKRHASAHLYRCKEDVRKRAIQALTPEEAGIHNVYNYIRTATTKACSADGGDINAELTKGSIDALVTWLRQEGLLSENAVLMDGGCAYNLFASHVAQRTGCKVWGIEYVPMRAWSSAVNMLAALADKRKIGKLHNPRVAYIYEDLFRIDSFGPTTVAYFFDEAFQPRLMHHIAACAARTPGLEAVLSFKASKCRSFHRTWAAYGFVLQQGSVQVNKTGSNESNTVYLYKKTSNVLPYVPICQLRHVSSSQLATTLTRAWSDDTRVEFYKDLVSKANEAYQGRRRVTNETPHICRSCPCCEVRNRTKRILWYGVTFGNTDVREVAQLHLDPSTHDSTYWFDTARCLYAEQFKNVCVHTVVRIEAPLGRFDRQAEYEKSNRIQLSKALGHLCGEPRYSEVSFDYGRGHMDGSMFFRHAIELGKLLVKISTVLMPNGCIYLPAYPELIERLHEPACKQRWITLYHSTVVRTVERGEDYGHNILYQATKSVLEPGYLPFFADMAGTFARDWVAEVEEPRHVVDSRTHLSTERERIIKSNIGLQQSADLSSVRFIRLMLRTVKHADISLKSEEERVEITFGRPHVR